MDYIQFYLTIRAIDILASGQAIVTTPGNERNQTVINEVPLRGLTIVMKALKRYKHIFLRNSNSSKNVSSQGLGINYANKVGGVKILRFVEARKLFSLVTIIENL